MQVGLSSFVVFAPFAVACALALTGRLLPPLAWRAAGLAASLASLAGFARMWSAYDVVDGGVQLVERAAWLPELGIHYFVGVDGISLMLVGLTALLVPVVLVASWNEIERSVRSWVFFLLALETGVLGAFVSLNLFLFYLFFEVMLVPMYFLIGIWGGPRRVHAALKFFVFTMTGSLVMLVGMLSLVALNREQGGALNFDWLPAAGSTALALVDTTVPLAGRAPWWQTQPFLFGAFALAFAIKVPVVPLHTWLPDAHVEAPTGGSVVLAGVLLKLGAYGFLRFALPLAPDAAAQAAPLFMTLAVVGILYGSLVALVQEDVKKLVAYTSVAHLGFVVLGAFAGNSQGMSGAVLQMVNHGLSTGALFVLVGFLYERRHTRHIAEFGGVARPMPVFAALFGLVMLASIGVPGLNGFVGELLILVGAFGARPAFAVAAVPGIVLGAWVMTAMYRRVMFGPVERPENRGLIDLGWRERLAVGALVVPIVAIGVHPDPLLRRIEPAVVATLHRIESRRQERPAPEEPAAAPSEGVAARRGGARGEG
ncbi:MAG: NADH-quinone oxidoreductase subunit M [Myxococcota bacterium]